MKKGVKTTLIVLGAVILVLGGLIFALISKVRSDAQQALAALVTEQVDMNSAKDGTYEGVADAGLVSVRVSVTVKDHVIEGIKILEHKNGKGQPAEAIVNTMIAKNSCEVDTISGATLSSKAIKCAVSRALAASVS